MKFSIKQFKRNEQQRKKIWTVVFWSLISIFIFGEIAEKLGQALGAVFR